MAAIVRARPSPSETEFVTPSDANLQVGFVVKEAGSKVPRHRHHELTRRIVGTSEVLIVREGRCEIDVYDDEGTLIATRELQADDVVILVAGGHGIRMHEKTVFLEVKQGPYPGVEQEKEVF